jgi:hypothetical protein
MVENQTIDNDSWGGADIHSRSLMLRQILPNKSMDELKLKNLLEIADEPDQVKLKVLYNAVIKGVNEYNKNSVQVKLKNWKSAEKELDLYIDKLWAKYIDKERTFSNLLAVVEYLKENNWKIGKSRAYEHQKEGKIQPQANGTFRLSDVEKYAATHLKRADGKSVSGELKNIQVEKAQAERDKVKEQVENLRWKNKIAAGLYVPRDFFERELAQRAIVFKSDLEAFCRSKAQEIVSLVGGDKERIPDLIDFMLREVAAWLNRYAADREFTVPAPTIESVLTDPDDDGIMEEALEE